MRDQGVRLTIIGETKEFPRTVRIAIEKASQLLAKNERIKVNIALNYGGRAEIVKAVKDLVKDGIKPSEVDEAEIEKKLYTNGQADPDLVIRTGGQVRLSNFLLWQASYSELYFTNTLWPDFDKNELIKALKEYENRVKNYGS
ncbi:MAG: di-trans,poly-cis-decaprenylcistransferase [Candidatus Woykebacteria bacterium RBG_13_40_7b]|uniref:Di-trans,poly-cis-decaprenylcistransferase n=1 Tax=Candidatus Woykebacteria bacterium RBG_13_40_7b TaxID=1802594 RepID=A0A1G1WA62_9BACT|nr:MAG: di-trans,poly-cis-decaprenylcistransferase [Candidatus Woykebacteria bacterium RBG_13_40_7b]